MSKKLKLGIQAQFPLQKVRKLNWVYELSESKKGVNQESGGTDS